MRTMALAVLIAIVIFGAGWIFVVSTEQDVRTETRIVKEYVPYQVPIIDTSCKADVQKLESEVSSLKRQLVSCQQQNQVVILRDYYRSSDEEWDLTVRVRDQDGDPIEDARVEIENSDDDVDYTDSDGEVEFRNLEEDCYDVFVDARGYEDEDDHICLHDDERITIRMYEY